jgi:hypothetical protein
MSVSGGSSFFSGFRPICFGTMLLVMRSWNLKS